MSETRKLLLKPASFQSSKNGNSSTNGSAPRLVVNNPFLKCEKEEEATKPDEKSNDAEKDPARHTTTNNLFQPAKTNLFASSTSSFSGNSSFVFGQHLAERVVIDNSKPPSEENNSNDKVNLGSDETSRLFSDAITSSKPPESDTKDSDAQIVPESNVEDEKNGEESNPVDKNMKLVEAARKYEEMRGAQKRKYEEVEITTGEEDERNILEINCKLFTFIENNYEERGRGILRLNDSKSGSHSRVVFRASGSFRLLLNTKVWRDQICEQPSQKSLRLTAFDTNGVVKIYLAMGRVDDMNMLFRALNSRIEKEKERTPEPEPLTCVVEEKEEEEAPIENEGPETKRKALAE